MEKSLIRASSNRGGGFNRNGRFEGVGLPTGYVEPWEGGQTQQFTGGRDGQGAIMKPDGSSNAYWVGGKIWQEFLNRGGAEYVGYPKTDAIRVKGGLDNSGGKVQHFRGAKGIPSKIWSSKHGAHPTWGAIGGRYDKMGGSSSWLGFPTSGEKGIGNGWVKQDFEGGYILWHPQHGTTVYNTKAVNSLPPDSGHGSTNEWTVKYWNNTNLSGLPAWTMTEPPGEIRFNAGLGAPVGTRGVKEDNFSTRWETTSHFEGGFYNFISQADDGVRVYVDGVKVIDKWKTGEPWSRRDAYIAIPEGEHNIVVEYFEKGGIAGQTFKWEPSGLLNDWTGDFRPVGYDGRSVHSTYVNTYQRNGAIPKLGYPINNVHVWEDGHTQDFEGGSQGRGAIMKSNANDNSYWVGGQIWTKFMQLGGARSVGYPKTDAIPVKGGLDKSGGQVQHFRGGRDGIPSKIWLSKHGAHPTWGAIGGRYDKMGGPSSWLGFPTSREQGIGNGWVKQDFEGGYILWHPQYGTTVYNTKAIDSLPPDSGNSSTSNWHAQYWNNKNLTGSPQWSKYEEMSDLRFHAGGGAPVGTRGIKEDQFGARWITTSYFDGGIYNFINQADDGVRVYVDGKLIIDKWKDSPFEERRAFATIEPGYHQVMVEYHENKGSAANLLRWEQANPPKEWAIEFFRGKDLNPKNLAGYRGGGTGFLNKDWGQGHEWGIPIGDNDFSDRSTTTRYFNEPGVYEFTSKSDDGVRVWINDQLVIDQWKLQALTTNKVLLALDKGYHRIRVEHYEDWGGAAILFDWKKVAGEPIYTYQPLDLDGGNSSGSGWLQPWVAEYYNNRDLQGAPVVTRIVNPTPSGWLGDFDLNWSQGSPDSKVSQDNFSSRLTTHRYLREGTYNFKLKGDDGVRVFINGEKVIDRWSNPPYDTPHEEEIVLPSGIHRIEVEHSEKYGRAYVGLDWDYLSDSSGDAVAPQLATIHAELEQQLGEGAVGVPVDNLQQKYYASPIPSGSYGPMWILPVFYQEFRGTQGRGAIFADTGHYVFGKLWEAYQNGGGVTQFGPPVASQKDLGNGAYELELQNGRLFWAPGMTNPTYYEYALGTPKTLTIPADAWRGEYFDNRNWAGDPLVVSQDSGSRGNLDKYWNSSQSPAPGMPKDNFSVRWTTNRPFDRGTYRFKADHDDGFIVSVNGQKPIDKMKEIATQTTGYATFTKGKQYPVEVKHREYGGGVRAKLGMEKASKYVVGLDANNNLSRELPGAFQKHGGYDRVGLPINDVHGWHHGYVQDFDHGKNGRGILMRRHNTNAFYYIHGKIWDTYLSKGGPRKFGYPTGDARDIGKGITYQPFQHGYIQIMGDGSVRAHTYNYKEFVGWAMPNRGTAHRHTPNLHHRTGGATGYKQWLTFDAWTHGEKATDTQLGTPDSRWFRIKGTDTWVPSAYTFGNPEGLPGGGGGGGGGGSVMTRQGVDYFKNRPQFYTTGNIFHNSGWGSNLLGGGWNRNNKAGRGTEGNCTWYAHGRVKELGGSSAVLNVMYENASQWDNQLRAAGYGHYIHSSPQPGDIAQWDSNHVAVVESVNNDGTITISESHWETNWDGGGLGTLHNVRTISKNSPTRYIRVPGVKVGAGDSGGGNQSDSDSTGIGAVGSVEIGGRTVPKLIDTVSVLEAVPTLIGQFPQINHRVGKVGLFSYDSKGNRSQNIDFDKKTILVVHGRGSSSSAENIKKLATVSAQKYGSTHQILAFDWKDLAYDKGLPPNKAARSITPVAAWAAETLDKLGINGDKLSIFGHSLGSYVASEIGRRKGGVKHLIAIDPAYPGTSYDIDGNTEGTQKIAHFRDTADHSLAFVVEEKVGSGSVAGDAHTANKANNSLVINYEGLLANPVDFVSSHSTAVNVVANAIANGYVKLEDNLALPQDLVEDKYNDQGWYIRWTGTHEGSVKAERNGEIKQMEYVNGYNWLNIATVKKTWK